MLSQIPRKRYHLINTSYRNLDLFRLLFFYSRYCRLYPFPVLDYSYYNIYLYTLYNVYFICILNAKYIFHIYFIIYVQPPPLGPHVSLRSPFSIDVIPKTDWTRSKYSVCTRNSTNL